MVCRDDVCQSVDNGAWVLGDRNILTANEALLGKYLWRSAVQAASLWRKVTVAKYGTDQLSRFPMSVHSTQGCSPGDLISYHEERMLLQVFALQVGNGHCVKFWIDTTLMNPI